MGDTTDGGSLRGMAGAPTTRRADPADRSVAVQVGAALMLDRTTLTLQ